MKCYKKFNIYKTRKENHTIKQAKNRIKNKEYEYKITMIKDQDKIYYLNPETQEPQQYLNFKKHGLKQDQNDITTIRAHLKTNNFNIKYLLWNLEGRNETKYYIIHQKLIYV